MGLMAGSLRGQRLGQTRPGTSSDIDPDSEERRLGLLLRELRIHAQMRRQDVADAVNLLIPGAGWTQDTVTMLQTGRRYLKYREMRALARTFQVTWDAILDTALGDDDFPVSPSGRLTAEQAVTIRERYAAGEPTGRLCTAFGVSTATISRVVNGVSWKTAGGPIVGSE
jgi:transcriptional regulator with XRE-family HTH domain